MSTKQRRMRRHLRVSEALRDAIIKRGLTAYAASKQTGVSVDAIQRFLNAQRGLTLSTVDKLADSLGLTLCPSDPPTGRH